MKQTYKKTYPTGIICIGKDAIASRSYFGSADMDIINADFEDLPKEICMVYSIRKQILRASEDASEEELSGKEVEFIRHYKSNDPATGYNQWPEFKA